MTNQNLIQKDVLHVSKFSTNLIFVHKLTMDLYTNLKVWCFLILQPANFKIREWEGQWTCTF